MKILYKCLLVAFLIELWIISIMKRMNITIQSWIATAIGTLVFLLPIQILLFLVSKDNIVSPTKRTIAKIVFTWISICYVLGGISTLTSQ